MDHPEDTHGSLRPPEGLRNPGEATPDLQHRIEALSRSIQHLHADIVAIGREQAEARIAGGLGGPTPDADEI